MKKSILLVLLLFLAGCSQKHIKQKSRKTFSGIKHELQEKYHTAVFWNEPINESITQGLSLAQAIEYAMRNNVQLQADLNTLGIASADLMQAQLFSNPTMESYFRIPKQRTITIDNQTTKLQADIEIDLYWNISDLWQVPLRKKIAEDQLEIVSLRILETIFEVYKEIKITYNSIIYWQAILANAQATLEQAKELNKQIEYRYNFGYNTEYDIHLSQAQIDIFEIDVIEANNQLTDFYARLRQLLNLPINSDPIYTTDSIALPAQLPSPDLIEQYMLQNRPEIHIAQMNIEKARHAVSLERANVFRDVAFGLAYEKETSGLNTRGPYFRINFPTFDLNQAQIARAKTILDQRQKELVSTQNRLLTETILVYQQVHTNLEKIPEYTTLLKSYQKAITFSHDYAMDMQLNWIQAMQAQLAYYDQRKQFLMLLMDTSKSLAQLERTIGSSLDIKFKLKKLPIDKLI